MRNICFLNSIKFWGGGEKLHLENASEFKKKGYNVIVLCNPNSQLWKKANSENINTSAIIVRNTSFLNPLKILTLVLFFKKHKIDTVLFSASQDLKLGSIAAKIAGVTNIVYLRGLSVPVKASISNRIIYKSFLTHIISNSEDTKKTILKNLGKYLREDKVHTIYHGIELNKSILENDFKLKEIQEKGRGVILGNAGRLTLQKGQINLIKIAKILKAKNIDFTLFIAGTGELESELQLLIEEYKLQENVILLGFVSEMEAFMNSIDIFLLSSLWEGFGYVIVEAMLKSKPAIAFNLSSNPEIIEADETGFLIDYPDLNMFAEKINLLITNKELRSKMGEKGLQSVKNRFQLADRVTELESYLLNGAQNKNN